ncbi:MAG: ABC transporter substrate-binding protein [Magnetococcales bacterium]|nr:ABC transporter substrate-binding protein [Magnetococcales bacterium]
MSHWRMIAGLVLGIGVVIILLSSLMPSSQKSAVRVIGLAGPMSGPFEAVGRSMRRGAQLAIEEANSADEVPDTILELAVVDDANVNGEVTAAEAAVESAEKLSGKNNILAVIGHYFSSATIAAGKVYAKREIPMITPSATHPRVTEENEWSFSIIQDDRHQATYLANYVVHGLSKRRIAVVYSDDLYGRSLRGYFVDTLKSKSLTPIASLSIDSNSFDAQSLDHQLDTLNKAEVIFLAMNYKSAAKVVRHLREKDVRRPRFIGGESLGGPHFIQEAGIHSDGVFATNPFLISLLGESARNFQRRFLHRYQANPDWVAAYSYEAARMIIASTVKVGTEAGEGVRIRNHLNRLVREYEAIDSIAGPIHFNAWGSGRRPISIGEVKNGAFVPARFQLTTIKYPELVKKRRSKEPVFLINGREMGRATTVFTGIHVNEIESFDPIDKKFIVNFLLWFRWDPSMNRKLNFEMTYGSVLSARIREKYFDRREGFNFIAYDVTAEMQGLFPLHAYPFDEQILQIRIKPKTKSRESLILVTDISDDSFFQRRLDFGPWEDRGHTQYTTQKSFIWSYRNPKYDKKLFELEHSQYNYQVKMRRKVDQYIIKLIPLLVLISIAYATFFLNFEYAASRFAVGIITILSAMSFHNTNKIAVGYLVKIDIFFIVTYILLFLVILETGIATFFHLRDQKVIANRLDIGMYVLYPVLFSIAAYKLLL